MLKAILITDETLPVVDGVITDYYHSGWEVNPRQFKRWYFLKDAEAKTVSLVNDVAFFKDYRTVGKYSDSEFFDVEKRHIKGVHDV